MSRSEEIQGLGSPSDLDGTLNGPIGEGLALKVPVGRRERLAPFAA
jgi:hypothetical protein